MSGKKSPTMNISEPHQPENAGRTPSHIEAVPPIVAMGASAGGLAAFTAFFEAMPGDSGMAFVLVQHLDPTQPSLMAELLQRHTAMPVVQVTDGMQVAANSVYIIPPNVDMAVKQGCLQLRQPTAKRGTRLPIDILFRSLAEDQREKAIGIILSGTGSDGTQGLKSIKGEGGIVMAQDPTTAQYEGMPQSAIATGHIDFVLPVERMPDQLLDLGHGRFQARDHLPPKRELKMSDHVSEKIFALLRSHTGHDFSEYKDSTFKRRVERRMAAHQIKRSTDYVRYLQQEPQEVQKLFLEMLIGVTSFFRDPEEFIALEQIVIPRLFEDKPVGSKIRVWVAGCSSGEEAYSIAMLLQEHMDRVKQKYVIQIFATDIDDQAVVRARQGLFPQAIVADVSPQRLQRFFTDDGQSYRIVREIREMVVFASHSLLKDPPFSNLDLVSFRNVMIYFDASLQQQVLPVLHYALNPKGILFLGSSESLGRFTTLFRPLERKHKLFERIDSAAPTPHPMLAFPITPAVKQKPARQQEPQAMQKSLRAIADEMLLSHCTPPAMIVDQRGGILYFHHHTSSFLEPVRGEASLNVFQMVRDGLKLPLIAALRKAVAQNEEIVYQRVKIKQGDQTRSITLRIKPVDEQVDQRRLLLVVFELDPEPAVGNHLPETAMELTAEGQQRILELEQELRNSHQYLETTIEELGTSNEDLRSTVEEYQASNEELKSTLEEMQTGKEELQSVNEELVTVNTEMHSKVEELARSNADFSNLLSNIDVAIIFLDLKLRIKRFNPAATQLVNLIDLDIGRPLNHLSTNLVYDGLLEDARLVLHTLAAKEVTIQRKGGGWYRMRVRPYRTAHNVIDGVILIFTETTES